MLQTLEIDCGTTCLVILENSCPKLVLLSGDMDVYLLFDYVQYENILDKLASCFDCKSCL